MLEVFRNTLLTTLYWVLSPIEDQRQAEETVKRILTKEKIDRKLAGQTSSMPFMNIKDVYISKKATFNIQDGLEENRNISNSGDRIIMFSGRIQYAQNYRDSIR